MHINKVNKNGTVNLNCISVYCKATAKLLIDRKFIKTLPNFYKSTDGRFRSKFTLDFTDGELCNLQNWEVIFHIPKFVHGPACTTHFYKQHQKNFREEMTINSFAARSTQYVMTKNLWFSEASNIDSLIGIYKEREDRSILEKFRRARPRDNESRVPPDSRIMKLFNLAAPELGAQINQFLQFENSEMTVFFLESELKLLQNQTWFCDGTFTICKDISEQQIYIISVLYQSEDKTRVFSYPVVFGFLKGKSFSIYNNMFKILNEKYSNAFGDQLRPKSINPDCEAALIKSGKFIYPELQIYLCQVHVRRSWERNLHEKVGKVNSDKNKAIFSKTLTLFNGAF